MVCVLLADGFEESEAVVPMDLLRRGGVEVMLAGVQSLTVKSSHALTVTADCLLSEVAPEQVEMVFVPGGLGGVNNLLAEPCVADFLGKCFALETYVAAICAGPTVLSRLGLIDGKKAVCYPTCTDLLPPAVYQPGETVVQDGKLLTGEAAGSAFDLGLAMLKVLKGTKTADEVRASVCYRG